MTQKHPHLLIDAHLDLAWNALSFNRDLTLELDELRRCEAHMTDEPSRGNATTSLPEMRRAGVAVCVATLLARSSPGHRPQNSYSRIDLEYANQSIAHAMAKGQRAYYRQLEDQNEICLIRTAGELDTHWRRWQQNHSKRPPIGVILSMEGADPIVDPDQVDQWWDEGLRAVGPVHYGKSHYAAGTGATGPLTEKGLKLLRCFERVGMILDVTHFCDESFFLAMDYFGGAVLASHHNCRRLVPGDRQLSDEQIKLLIERDAIIGAAFDAWMLYPDWVHGKTSPTVVGIDAAADHIDYICQLAGSCRHCAIGTDLDGGFGNNQTPHDLRTITDIQKLSTILADRGYSNADIDAIFHGNWLRFFENALPS